MTDSLRVLSLQPFYGGSHKQFNDGWASHSRFEWTTLGLPASHWKWRMRHSALHYATEISRQLNQGKHWDVIFCTDMLHVAELKGLLPSAANQIPVVLYFHENQFAYPISANQKRDLHFAFTNFVSAAAADHVWFNSKFNLDSMLDGIDSQAKLWPDFVPKEPIEILKNRSQIQPPGMETPNVDLKSFQDKREQKKLDGDPIHLVWAARWEHDKNPDGLLNALIELQNRKCDFRISVIGESYSHIPAPFNEIQERFKDQIEAWGYQESRESYWEALATGDVFISTANHEFFGISAAEAMIAGLVPLLPDRLAYPELIRYAVGEGETDKYFYDGSATDFANRIELLVRERQSGKDKNGIFPAKKILDKLAWPVRAHEMDDALFRIAKSQAG